MPEADYPFYVYELVDKVEGGYVTVYIGKGSGGRLRNQKRTHRRDGAEICRFMDEHEAYMFERHMIMKHWPRLNIAPGRRTPQEKSRDDTAKLLVQIHPTYLKANGMTYETYCKMWAIALYGCARVEGNRQNGQRIQNRGPNCWDAEQAHAVPPDLARWWRDAIGAHAEGDAR